ncbi:hypothetical protein NZD89_15555 [Alicyclobacillus fastidiosus]|uniref:Uncharacterized protein n=1 Tax=Alicyclobacillus fastidiosus TaxID=392011 RepID=A0ABY6ZAA5_9BACL|nr:hypothetical protein [Alicyclobacillus fastidiosus]WAH39818.1 hypothetical protein NZD89_15555 [Alicyclobacillus fastidiosus]GMA61075.1 hypothetical protein GCM10025859_15150 [Alicyclobacillus fastidiosus]
MFSWWGWWNKDIDEIQRTKDELLLERAQEILAIELFHRQLLVRASHQNFEDLFRTLIDDEGQTPGLIEDRCDRLGSALDRLPLIMLIGIHDRSQVQSVIDPLIDLRTEFPPGSGITISARQDY